MGWKRGLTRIAGVIAFVPLVCLLAFGLYGLRIMHSERMVRLQEKAASYGCIDSVFNRERPRWQAEPMLARYYLDDGKSHGPSLSWHFRFAFTTWAIDLFTSAEQANRLHAALPYHRRLDGYDGIARSYAGKPFCALSAAQQQAVRQFHAGSFRGGKARIEAAMRGEPGA
jgi:hypothetical protein